MLVFGCQLLVSLCICTQLYKPATVPVSSLIWVFVTNCVVLTDAYISCHLSDVHCRLVLQMITGLTRHQPFPYWYTSLIYLCLHLHPGGVFSEPLFVLFTVVLSLETWHGLLLALPSCEWESICTLKPCGGHQAANKRKFHIRRASDCCASPIVFRKTDSIHNHHPEGVVYRSFCLNSSTFAVSGIASRRWWCMESRFPVFLLFAGQLKWTG